MAGTTTLQTLREATYGVLNEPNTSNVYSNSLVDQYINDQILHVFMKKKWQFAFAKQLLTLADNTTLAEDITTSDTDFDINSATNFQTAGATWVEGDIISYTGITTNTLTGVTNIDINHSEGAFVAPLYKVPSDYFREPTFMTQDTNADNMREIPYVDNLNYNNYNNGTAMMSRKFTIVTNEDEELFLRVDGVASGDLGVFYYRKRPNYLTADSDVCDIPDEWVLKVIPPLAAAKLMMIRGDNMDGLAESIEVSVEKDLFQMEKYYGQREEGWSRLVQSTYRSVHPYAYYRRRTRYE